MSERDAKSPWYWLKVFGRRLGRAGRRLFLGGLKDWWTGQDDSIQAAVEPRARWVRRWWGTRGGLAALALVLFFWRTGGWWVEAAGTVAEATAHSWSVFALLVKASDDPGKVGADPGKAVEAARNMALGVGALFTVFIGGGLAFWRTLSNHVTARATDQKMRLETFTSAVAQLGDESIAIRIGAIQSLEHLSKMDEGFYPRVIETLCAFIREHRPWPPKEEGEAALRAELEAEAAAESEASEPAEGGEPDAPPVKDRVTALRQEIGERNAAKEKELDALAKPKVDIQQALDVLRRRDRRWERADTKVDLRETDLRKADLSRGRLAAALLTKTVLDGADLIGAHLEKAHLTEADLEKAHLGWTHLEGTNLHGAHLAGAILAAAHLEGADLRWAHLKGANLAEAHLEGADLGLAHLEGATLIGAHLEEAFLDKAHLEGADLRGAHLEGADLRWAHLEGADLRGARLDGANLDWAEADDRTDLRTVKYSDKSPHSIDLSGAPNLPASFKQCRFDQHTLWPEGYWAPGEREARLREMGIDLDDGASAPEDRGAAGDESPA